MADSPKSGGSDLARSVGNMSTMLSGGPAVAMPMVAHGVASKIHEAVGRQNDTNTTDGSKPQPTHSATMGDSLKAATDWFFSTPK